MLLPLLRPLPLAIARTLHLLPRLPVMKRKFADFAAGRIPAPVKPMATSDSLKLEPREAQLRDLLVDVAASVDADASLPEPLVLRWAGGWVRDRLLGTTSHDIDVAINAMTGLAFGERLRAFCDVPANAARHNVGPDDIGSLHKIAANPEKSKNLETTTVKVFGLDLDFVNLRTETYADDSRNPVVEFGTASDDARRRDATVNALFYNLHTRAVEDFVGGLADMKARLIRTPLEPLTTFTDDPLRVLRLVRFASRLDFAIDPAARAVMADPQVLESLRIKISRERVGVELEKMLKGNNPRLALQLIDELKLHEAIYTDPARDDIPAPALDRWHVAYRLLARLAADQAPGSIYDVLVRTADEAYFAWSLASLAPWSHIQDPRPHIKGRPTTLAGTVAREGAKAPNKLYDVVNAAHLNRAAIKQLKEDVCAGRDVSNQRDTMGMAIRAWDDRDLHWRVQVLNAILVDAMDNLETLAEDDEYPEMIAGWQRFLDHLADTDLMEAPSIKRLVDGKLLAKALGVKPGRWTGQALDICLEWQLRNPNAEDPAPAIEEVRKRAGELGIKGLA
ncbi:tRNA nucleotidyltransferase [Plectosphaerella plurivora]|uniref:tRNA nucleotidyltransferase n=1 Tax=Plectosphaerella plurivora TaxID=936078 RepID=A0A9P9A6V9_9PEZI|nr:tRNA nucleotidyltransferase [Plectosphaerella plurivora]